MGPEFQKKRWRWAAALLAAAAVWVIWNPGLAGKALGKIGEAFLPFGAGLGIAFVLNVPLRFLEERFFAGRKVKRWVLITVTYLLAAGVLCVLLFLIIPQLKKSAGVLLENLPGYLAQAETWTHRTAQKLGPWAADFTQNAWEAVSQWMEQRQKTGPEMVDSTVNMAANLFQGTVNLLAGVVFSIYLLAKKEALCLSCKGVLFAFLPRDKARKLSRVGRLTTETFRKFAAGQLTEAFLLGAFCFLGMALLQMPYAPLISAMIGVTALIPIFGAVFGTAAGAFILLMERPVTAIWFVAFILVLQQVESNFLYPRVVGDSIGLPGIWVLLAVTAGGSLFGVLGMLAGIPLASVAYTLFRETVAVRLKRRDITKEELARAGEPAPGNHGKWREQ